MMNFFHLEQKRSYYSQSLYLMLYKRHDIELDTKTQNNYIIVEVVY